MAGLRFERLVERFVGAIERQGSTVILEALSNVRPARMRVDGRGLIVFLWTITPGGGPVGTRPANERRIQITNVAGLPLEPGSRTLLGGYSEETGVWAFWDARRHVRFSQRSPSLQVSVNSLERASHEGVATQLRPTQSGGEEVVVAIRPDSLAWYVLEGFSLHNSRELAGEVTNLLSATPEVERSFLDADLSEEGAARRYDLVQIMRAYRDSRFRPSVLQAYSYCCAVCGYALKLVDAAHIIPVSHPTSTDDVTNGLALCRLHHAAYDNALIGIDSDYRVLLNSQTTSRLRELNLHHGIDDFRTRLPERIRVPGALEVRPNPDYLRIGLQARGWPASAS